MMEGLSMKEVICMVLVEKLMGKTLLIFDFKRKVWNAS